MTLAGYTRSLAVTFLLHYSITLASIFVVGRIGKTELGAVSLATVTANITCYSPIQGLATSLDTLCAQAYGSGHRSLVALWYHADTIFATFIPEKDTALLAARYLRILVVGTPGVAAFEAGKRFVQAQGLFHGTTYVLLLGAPFNIFLNWLLVWKLDWGFAGAPIAMACTQLLLPVLLLGYVCFIDGSQCWDGFSWRAFSNWGPMLKLALPGLLMIEAQYFAFELLTIVSGQFGGASLAAQSILVTLGSASYQVPFAVSIAASTRVANLIGTKLSHAAWTSAKVALSAGFIVGIFNMIILGMGRHVLPGLLTADSEVRHIVLAVLPTLAVMQVFDAMAATSHGLLRGIGRQFVGGYTNLLSFYLVALPISFSTSFALGWKLQGLWVGVTVGLLIVTFIEMVYLFNADWERAVDEAENRVDVN
ncbi:MATE efflux family protein [Pleurostoma richardsiae]|uniref:MATE efflux family protein n=1 Tax=Pleurostoma richardsiae TaxID=41990 RepID=A0AA38VGP8_9PEZI|nr:MATE efflux family protein [Pleurostoma richardsiae]